MNGRSDAITTVEVVLEDAVPVGVVLTPAGDIGKDPGAEDNELGFPEPAGAG